VPNQILDNGDIEMPIENVSTSSEQTSIQTQTQEQGQQYTNINGGGAGWWGGGDGELVGGGDGDWFSCNEVPGWTSTVENDFVSDITSAKTTQSLALAGKAWYHGFACNINR
jgi:hypothetical protein